MNNQQVIHEDAQNEIAPQENQPEHSEMNMGEDSLFNEEAPTEFVEESFEKVEEETQLFTSDQEVNNSISTQESLNSESPEQSMNENFYELNSEDKNDLEIPAFLRRQTN
jgi:cell division protein FtsZ